MRTSNPVLKEATFDAHEYLTGMPAAAKMTMAGTLNKCLAMFAMVVASAFASAYLIVQNPAMLLPLAVGGAISGLGLCFFTCARKDLSPILAPLYAVVEGLFVGAISLVFEVKYPGIVLNAALGTFGTMGAVLVLYRLGVLRATPTFVKSVVFATIGVAGIYIFNLILRLFGMQFSPIYQAGPVGIGFSVVVCIIAALNFVLDFDVIDKGVDRGAPKYMEWYGAFGITVTLVWLYVELLRLLRKLR